MKKLMFIGIALVALAGTAKSQAGVSVDISLGDGYRYRSAPLYQPVTPYCAPAPQVYVAPPAPVYVIPRERCYVPHYEHPRYEYWRPRWHERNHFERFRR